MKFVIGIIISLNIMTACSKPQQVSLDPYYPNYGIKVKDLKRGGYQLTTVDDGVCVYSNDAEKFDLVFYGKMEEECKSVHMQELYIYPNEKPGNYDFDESKGRIVTAQDSINFLNILKPYGTTSIFNIHNINLCVARFYGKNNDGKVIEWSATGICSDGIILSNSAKIN